ncbi:MAG: hypothetical protein HRU11_15390, partial [Parvularculaceae bacterium]|nr:hypothetical protein [Parvularculaceae bacterium]
RSNNTRYCRIRPKGSPIESAFLEMHPREFQFADTEMWRPLVEEMRRTKDFGWRVIEQGPTPAENGMCGTAPYDHNAYEPDHISVLMYEPVERGTRWYRRPDDGATIQLGNEISNKGMFHPNELGYAHVARLLLADLDEADGIEPDGLGRKLNPDLDPDQDDAISEAQLAQRGAPLQQFQLSSEHDVAMRRFAVEACEAVTVTGLSSRRAEISVTVFKSNGEVVVSSQAGRQATPDLPPLDLSGITGRRAQSETRTLERSPLTDSLSNKTISKLTAPADSSCSAEAFAEVDRPRFESATGASVQFVPERQALYYVAVSHRDNDSFDPITGRGDLRLEAPRAAVDVGLMVRQ